MVSTAEMGSGFPDLLVAKNGVLRQVEVKDPKQPANKRALSSDQRDYHARLAAAGCPVLVIETDADVDAIDRGDCYATERNR